MSRKERTEFLYLHNAEIGKPGGALRSKKKLLNYFTYVIANAKKGQNLPKFGDYERELNQQTGRMIDGIKY